MTVIFVILSAAKDLVANMVPPYLISILHSGRSDLPVTGKQREIIDGPTKLCLSRMEKLQVYLFRLIKDFFWRLREGEFGIRPVFWFGIPLLFLLLMFGLLKGKGYGPRQRCGYIDAFVGSKVCP